MHGFLAILRRHILVEGRKKSLYVVRTLAVGLVALCSLFAVMVLFSVGGATSLEGGWVFVTFAIVQTGILALWSVLVGATTVTQEREGGTLAVLTASGFRPVAILGGLALGRWLPIAVGILAGLPLALCLLVFGGISPQGFLVGYVIMISATVLVVGLAAFASSLSRSTMQAIVASVLFALLLFWIAPSLGLLTLKIPFGSFLPAALEWFSPFTALVRVTESPLDAAGLSLKALTWALAGVGFVILGGWPTGRMATRVAAAPARRARGAPGRPVTVRGNPVAWLDRERTRGRLVFYTLSGTILLLVVAGLTRILGDDATFGLTYLVVTICSSIVGLTVWVLTMVYAIGSFAGRATRASLPAILATPLTAREIVGGKLRAIAIRLLPFACIHAGMNILTAGFPGNPAFMSLDDAALYLMGAVQVISGIVSLAFTVFLALAFSLWTRNVVKAFFLTIGAQIVWSIVVGIASWIVSMILIATFQGGRGSGFASGPSSFIVVAALIGLVVSGAQVLVCFIIWRRLVTRFDRIVGRCSSDVRDALKRRRRPSMRTAPS